MGITMIVKRRLNMERKPRKPLTEEEIAEIEARAPRDEDIAYDEDCPPSTPEQLELFRHAARERNLRRKEQGTT